MKTKREIASSIVLNYIIKEVKRIKKESPELFIEDDPCNCYNSLPNWRKDCDVREELIKENKLPFDNFYGGILCKDDVDYLLTWLNDEISYYYWENYTEEMEGDCDKWIMDEAAKNGDVVIDENGNNITELYYEYENEYYDNFNVMYYIIDEIIGNYEFEVKYNDGEVEIKKLGNFGELKYFGNWIGDVKYYDKWDIEQICKGIGDMRNEKLEELLELV